MRSLPRPSQNRGLTLAEVVITLGIVGASMLTILGMLSTGMNLHSRSAEQTQAMFLAERIFADLTLPTNRVPPGDTEGRFLGEFFEVSENAVDVYGEILDFSKDQIPENGESPPICWIFGRDFQNLPHGRSTAAFLGNAEQIYRYGADGREFFDAEYLVGIRISSKLLFGAKPEVETLSAGSKLQIESRDDGADRLVFVSVEIPAQAPEESRRKYHFQRVITLGE